MNKSTLILFPLITMFLLALVNAPSAFTGRAEFSADRSITDNQLENVVNFIHELQDNYYDKSQEWFYAYDMIHEMIQTKIWEKLAAVFDRPDRDAQWDMAWDLSELVRSYCIEAGGPEPYIPEEDIYEIIRFDPDTISETEDLWGLGITMSDTIFFVGLFIGLIAFVAIIGLRVFSTGLSGASISIMFQLVAMFLMWGILSLFSMGLLLELPIVGGIIWIFLSFSYTIGVLMSLTSSGGGDE